VAAFFPDLLDPATLRTLALGGIDAARSAGATYADIRVANRRHLEIFVNGIYPYSNIGFDVSYGLRVLVDGAWGFVYDFAPTPDAVVRAARTAVSTARGIAKIGGRVPAMTPAPVVTGEWTTPVAIDPFAVSPDDHVSVYGAYVSAGQRVPDGLAEALFCWSTETRVFASSEGSLVTQQLMHAEPRVGVGVMFEGTDSLGMYVTDFAPASAGFEIALGTHLQDRVKEATEEVAQFFSYPVANVEVGRYEAVFDGTSVGALLGATINPALELDRVLGHHADDSGSSFLGPVTDVLGHRLFSPQLTVSAGRSAPLFGAAKWDDEGCATKAFPLIDHGTVVDYFTTRTTASALTSWYASQGKAAHTCGSAVTLSPVRSPSGRASQLTMASGTSGTSLETLTQRISNGMLVRATTHVVSDQQLANSACYPNLLFEVKHGRITRRLRHAGMQFSTKRLWQSLTTVGDATTAQCRLHQSTVDQPWAKVKQAITAPAAHFREIDVIQLEQY